MLRRQQGSRAHVRARVDSPDTRGVSGSHDSETGAHQSRLAAAARPHDRQQPAQRPTGGSSGAGSGAGTLFGRLQWRLLYTSQAEALRLAHSVCLCPPGCMQLSAHGLPLGVPDKPECIASSMHAAR